MLQLFHPKDKFYFEKYGVKFINICPGKTYTPMIDQLCKTLQKIGQSKSLDDLVDHERPIQRYDISFGVKEMNSNKKIKSFTI